MTERLVLFSQEQMREHDISEEEMREFLHYEVARCAAVRAKLQPDWNKHRCVLCEDPTRVWHHEIGSPTKAARSPAECINNPGMFFGSWPMTITDLLEWRTAGSPTDYKMQ